ncbi:argininosuccinate lyase [Blattabacterium sp. (Blatta orientalis) str. Tarazona]|uniref:argininosuccinate lyase n=1 Tax=Blattabacterium sp. (Blatta orientalis) TaxID=367806 RepID=UPI0002AD8FB8|nr:argininosuccinate lyase [Blattabacterium sp. (Blatta orientalis)]AGD98246.1 argininosuccinate lyase [Blattabacterium sp. (Blatta orientalis) str. Tarazona]
MKIWEKDIHSHNRNREIEEFTSGKDSKLDLLLAPHDVIGTIAHVMMLESIGLLNQKDLEILIKELRHIYIHEILTNNFQMDEGIEDVHSQIEFLLTDRLGKVGKKIHSGRSRNDQILVDLKLFIRTEIKEIVLIVYSFFDLLLQLSEQYKNILMPGYTHYQIAMPSSFGLWFSAYAESLIDDMLLIHTAYRITNKNPLGSAAGYGSSFPLNRKMTTELLGFENLNYNVVYAQMGRGKMERIVTESLASLARTLSKMSQDICLYLSQNYNFISFPDFLTTGSSIMPHKKNPDVFEIIRAKCNRISSLPNEISLIVSNLCSGYHRDFQIIKERFLPVFDELKKCFSIFRYMLNHIVVRKDILREDKYKYLFSVEVVNQLVQKGYSFREAYQKVATDIKNERFKPLKKNFSHSHEGSIGNLCNQEIRDMMRKLINKFDFEIIQKVIERLVYGKNP